LLAEKLTFTPGVAHYTITARVAPAILLAGLVPATADRRAYSKSKRWWPQGTPNAGPFPVRLPVRGTLTLKAA
jgi:hypothetical protein